MTKNSVRIVSFVLLAAVLLAACAPEAPAETPVEVVADTPTVEVQPSEEAPKATVDVDSESEEAEGFTVVDALGREVFFERAPERMMLTGRAWFLLVDALYAFPEAEERLVAMGETNQGTLDFFALIDDNFDGKAILSHEVNAEEMAAQQPDVVFMKSYLAESAGAPLEEIGIPVVYLDLETPEQYQRDLATIGQIYQNEARTQEVLEYFQTMAGQVTEKTDGLSGEERPSVLLVYYNETDGQAAVQVPPLSWLQTEMVKMAGGQPVWEGIELGNGWTKINFEQVAVWNPDKIFVVAYKMPVDEAVDAIREDANWQALDALQNGEIYAFPGDYFSWDQPDTRWVLGLNWLATKIQPDLFAETNLEALTFDFYATLYGLDADSFGNVLSRITGDYP